MIHKNNRVFISILTIIVFLFWGVLGVVFSSKIQTTLIKWITSVGSGITAATTKQEPKEIDLALLWEAYGIIKNNFYSFGAISEKELVYGVIKGMTDSLKDKHTEFFTPEETEKFNEALTGDFEGIGAVILHSDFWVLVERILAGSPAKDADVRNGDIITKANGIELKDLELTDAVNKIRGPAGTKVTLEILRPGEIGTITKDVIRRKIEIPSVDSKTLSGSIGYIALSVFGEKTAENFQKQLFALYDKKITGLIIDLRDNGGGFLDAAVDILSNFIEKDKLVVVTKEKNPFLNKSYFSKGIVDVAGKNQPIRNIPIVILINGNSASASEITAGALKDYKLAILVGEKSYGKGSVQEPFSLSDGSELKVTIAKWYTPLDHGIDGIGITPDREVTFEKDDYEKKFDRQLEEAKTILKQFEAEWYTKTIESIAAQKEAKKQAVLQKK